MAKIGFTGFTGFRFRSTRGGTPNEALALSQRGQGGVRLSIGGGRYAMMTEADAALSESERARLFELRKRVEIVGIEDLSQVASSGGSKIEIPEMIDDPRLLFKVAKKVVPGSLLDGRRSAAEINKQNPGRKIRIPTEAELLKLNKLLGKQLKGRDYWIWTETKDEDYPEQFVLRLLNNDNRHCNKPGNRPDCDAVRFVEDK